MWGGVVCVACVMCVCVRCVCVCVCLFAVVGAATKKGTQRGTHKGGGRGSPKGSNPHTTTLHNPILCSCGVVCGVVSSGGYHWEFLGEVLLWDCGVGWCVWRVLCVCVCDVCVCVCVFCLFAVVGAATKRGLKGEHTRGGRRGSPKGSNPHTTTLHTP